MLGFGVSRLTPTYMETIFEIGSSYPAVTESHILHRSLQYISFRCFPKLSFREMKREAGAFAAVRFCGESSRRCPRNGKRVRDLLNATVLRHGKAQIPE
jgi:hypothetical protein